MVSESIDDDIASELRGFADELAAFASDRPHDDWARVVVTSAVVAGLEGNAAVGALLASPDGAIIASERNRMFIPYFRSDYHAEMVLLSGFERDNKNANLRDHTLVTSLEPCEMCMIRIINSGVTNVLYVAPDIGKGAITGPNGLAPHWARLAEPQHFAATDSDPRLGEIALTAFEKTIGRVSDRLMTRRLPHRVS